MQIMFRPLPLQLQLQPMLKLVPSLMLLVTPTMHQRPLLHWAMTSRTNMLTCSPIRANTWWNTRMCSRPTCSPIQFSTDMVILTLTTTILSNKEASLMTCTSELPTVDGITDTTTTHTTEPVTTHMLDTNTAKTTSTALSNPQNLDMDMEIPIPKPQLPSSHLVVLLLMLPLKRKHQSSLQERLPVLSSDLLSDVCLFYCCAHLLATQWADQGRWCPHNTHKCACHQVTQTPPWVTWPMAQISWTIPVKLSQLANEIRSKMIIQRISERVEKQRILLL